MGLGGHLTWTAVAREVRRKHCPVHGDNVKVLPNENGHICRSELFEHNPNFVFDENEPHFPLNMSMERFAYNRIDENNIHHWTADVHMTRNILNELKIHGGKIEPEFHFSQLVDQTAKELLAGLATDKPIIAIEPHSKVSFTPNKEYPFEKWQYIVNQIPDEFEVVQVSMPGKRKLDGVKCIDSMSFVIAARFLQDCILFIGPEGGLGHAAAGVDTASLIVYTPWIPPFISAYDSTIIVDVMNDPKRRLPKSGPLYFDKNNHQMVQEHDPIVIVEALNKFIAEWKLQSTSPRGSS